MQIFFVCLSKQLHSWWKDIRFAVQTANTDGVLPLHFLCGSRPSVQTLQYLLGLFEGALGVMANAGDLPLILACKASSSQSVLQVLLTAYPEALTYMQEYYSSHATV